MKDYRNILKDLNYFSLLSFGINFIFLLFVPLFITGMARGQEILPVSQIKPGMKVYALTVFSGKEPERFEGIVEGVQPPYPDFLCDQIFIEFNGGPVNERGHIISETRIMSGMSGSPVFIADSGKIIGSIVIASKGSMFPQAIVYPIECSVNFKTSLDDILKTLENKIDRNKIIGALNEWDESKHSLKAGDYFSFCPITGDHKLCGGGTVTMVDPRDSSIVYLMGHRAEGLEKGTVALPLFRAEVITISPNLVISQKIGKPTGEMLGTLIFNGQFGQIGKLNVFPKLFPLHVSLIGAFGDRILDNNYKLAYTGAAGASVRGIIESRVEMVDDSNDTEMSITISSQNFPPIFSWGKLNSFYPLVSTVEMLIGRELAPAINNIDIKLEVRPKYLELGLREASCSLIEDKEKNKKFWNIKISAGNDSGNYEYLRTFLFDEKFVNQTLHIANGEKIATTVLGSKLPKSKIIELLNQVVNRNLLYIYSKKESTNKPGMINLSSIFFAESKKTEAHLNSGTDTVSDPGYAGQWNDTGNSSTEIEILHTIPITINGTSSYYIDGEVSFTVPGPTPEVKTESVQPLVNKKEKKKKFILF